MNDQTIEQGVGTGVGAVHIRSGVVEIDLPEWSGRLTPDAARRYLDALEELVAQARAAIERQAE